ncbi:MAG: metal ABC transporter permease [Planctomycetota bacterium]|nr:metal ABC transporter permease [Planctomycetota bacterium]
MRPLSFEVDGWIILVGALAGAACAVPGSWLLVRGRLMAGDAVTHAVLPGIAGAFLMTGSRDPMVMLIGAAISGVACLLLAVLLERTLRVDKGAALGTAFTVFFAVGLVLIVRGADRVDLDPSCVLYGALELTPVDRVDWFGMDLPRALPILTTTLVACALASFLFFKELRLAAFDPAFANAIGARPLVMDLLLAALVALVSVAAFESVGSILVVALLAALPAAARMLTNRMGWILVIGPLLGAVAAVIGHASAILIPPLVSATATDTSSAGAIAVASGAIFAVCVALGPEDGLLPKLARQSRLRLRIAREEALAQLWRARERETPLEVASLLTLMDQSALRRRTSRGALRMLRTENHVSCDDGIHLALTPTGAVAASQIIRSHRLWESFLASRADIRPDHVHTTATLLEHVTTPELAIRLADEAASTTDPHGHSIPRAENPTQD